MINTYREHIFVSIRFAQKFQCILNFLFLKQRLIYGFEVLDEFLLETLYTAYMRIELKQKYIVITSYSITALFYYVINSNCTKCT